MKPIYFLLFGLTLIITGCGGHSWESTQHLSLYLKTVSYAETDKAWIAGRGGIISHTIDGGNSWLSQNSNTTFDLNKIVFLDSQVGYAVGNGGIILHTNNGGIVWIEQRSNTNEALNDVFFLDGNQGGWMVGNGGVVLHTQGSGRQWSRRAVPTTHNLLGVYFVDRDHGWIVGGNGLILVTTDGGSNWGQQLNIPTNQDLRSVFFIDQNNGFAAGGNGFTIGPMTPSSEPHQLLLRTTNAGQSWNVVFNRPGDPLHQITFADATHGWVTFGGEYYISSARSQDSQTGATGGIYHTQDGGNTWNQQTGGLIEPVYDISFLDVNNGMAIGAYTGKKYSVVPVPRGRGYVQADPVSTRIWRTTNGGRP